MALSKIWFYVLLVSASYQTQVKANSFQNIEIYTGESKEFRFPKADRLRVSRRGHIDLMPVGDRRWRLTALRAGVVMISPAAMSSEPFRVLVNIKTRPYKSRSKKTAFKASKPPPSFRIHLDVELKTIKNRSSVGLEPKIPLRTVEYELKRSQENSSLLAQPRTDMSLRTPLHLQSGGEFKTLRAYHDSASEDWKSFGMVFDAELLQVENDRATLSFDLAISSAANRQGRLARHRLKSQTEFPLGTFYLAGVLDTVSKNYGKEDVPFVANLPILGPLLTIHNQDFSHQKIYIWIKITRLQTS